MRKIIAIREHGTHKLIHEVDVTNKIQTQIDRIESGMNINLNHKKYYTQQEQPDD
jgi:hypothetical protein